MRQRLFCAVVAACLLSSPGAAQTGLRSASLPDRTPTAPIPPPRSDLFLAGPDTFAPRFDRQIGRDHHRRRFFSGGGYVSGLFGPEKPYRRSRSSAHRSARTEANGYLQLHVQPGTAQVYIDGVYMGTVDDFRRLVPGRSLEPGTHRLELRAPGYETMSADVRVFPDEITTYQSDLKLLDSNENRALGPRPVPKTFYVIPGCYAGDKPPRTVRLPPTCDASKVRTVPPTVSIVARSR